MACRRGSDRGGVRCGVRRRRRSGRCADARGRFIQRRRWKHRRAHLRPGGELDQSRALQGSVSAVSAVARCAAALGRRRSGYDGTAASHDKRRRSQRCADPRDQRKRSDQHQPERDGRTQRDRLLAGARRNELPARADDPRRHLHGNDRKRRGGVQRRLERDQLGQPHAERRARAAADRSGLVHERYERTRRRRSLRRREARVARRDARRQSKRHRRKLRRELHAQSGGRFAPACRHPDGRTCAERVLRLRSGIGQRDLEHPARERRLSGCGQSLFATGRSAAARRAWTCVSCWVSRTPTSTP